MTTSIPFILVPRHPSFDKAADEKLLEYAAQGNVIFRINYTLFPLTVCLLKLHLNHPAILTPNPTHLRNRTLMSIFGVVTSFTFTHRTHQTHTLICIALPIMVNQQGRTNRMSEDLKEFVKNLGYKTIESHMVYVHRTLTREIMVYEKD